MPPVIFAAFPSHDVDAGNPFWHPKIDVAG